MDSVNTQTNEECDDDEDDDLKALEAVIDHRAMSDLIAFLRFVN